MIGANQLAGIEAGFQDNILTGDPAIDSQIEGTSAQLRNARLEIYRNAYRLRLIEVLATDYEVLHTYLGDELFDALARDYIAAHPSTFRNVRWFGGKLEEFLRSVPRYAERPELAELAQFEWSLGLAFDAPDRDPVRFEDIAAVAPQAWDGLRFQLHPSLRTAQLRTNAVTIWKAISNADSPRAPETLAAPVTWAIWRKQFSPFFRSMDDDEAWAVGAVIAQASFGDICAGLCEWVTEKEAAARAAGMLRGWVESGWIAQLLVAT